MPAAPANLAAYFEDVAENMLRFFEGWDRHVPHEGEKGGVRERRVLDFLKRFLPGKYGVASGHIIDRQGAVSLQEDIVIFDAIYSPILPIDEYYQVFPCETVYATVEVKSTLDRVQVAKCITHAERLHELDRGQLETKIQSFVFAYDSYESKELPSILWAAEAFQDIACQDSHLRPMPSVIASLRQKFVLHFGLDTTKHIAQKTKSAILLFFLTTILKKLDNITTEPPYLFEEYAWSRENPIEHFSYSVDTDCVRSSRNDEAAEPD